MKQLSITIGVVLMCSAGVAAGQASTTSAQGDNRKPTKDAVVTVTGCVAQSPDGKQYMLNDAIMAPASGRTAADPVKPGTPGDKAVLSYVLSGGEMKSHVGHKVQVSGTIADAAVTTDMSGGQSKGDPAAAGMDHKDVAGTLKVKSMKMVAASCM